VNPIVELLKGRMKWRDMGASEKSRLIITGLILLVCLGLIVSSISKPVRPDISQGVERAI
jgi:hypothetical protein